jgi:hypothetical protein
MDLEERRENVELPRGAESRQTDRATEREGEE